MRKMAWKEFFPPNYADEVNKSDDDFFKEEPKKIITTPTGHVSISNFQNPMNKFDFWVGTTNFKLTATHLNMITNLVDGVESINFLTPYRMLISVGLLFDNEKVRMDIEHLICDKIKKDLSQLRNPDIINKIRKDVEDFEQKFWLIYVFVNGRMIKDQFNDKEIFLQSKEVYEKCNEYSTGFLLTSEDT